MSAAALAGIALPLIADDRMKRHALEAAIAKRRRMVAKLAKRGADISEQAREAWVLERILKEGYRPT